MVGSIYDYVRQEWTQIDTETDEYLDDDPTCPGATLHETPGGVRYSLIGDEYRNV